MNNCQATELKNIDLTTLEILVPTGTKTNTKKYIISDFSKMNIDKITLWVNLNLSAFPSLNGSNISIQSLEKYMQSQSMYYTSISESMISHKE